LFNSKLNGRKLGFNTSLRPRPILRTTSLDQTNLNKIFDTKRKLQHEMVFYLSTVSNLLPASLLQQRRCGRLC